jgi:hypothetical protein
MAKVPRKNLVQLLEVLVNSSEAESLSQELALSLVRVLSAVRRGEDLEIQDG